MSVRRARQAADRRLVVVAVSAATVVCREILATVGASRRGGGDRIGGESAERFGNFFAAAFFARHAHSARRQHFKFFTAIIADVFVEGHSFDLSAEERV